MIPEVQAEFLNRWGEMGILDTVGVDGFRVDAIKHIDGDFFNGWLDHLEAYSWQRPVSAWGNTGPTISVP